jgi:hypothetical protein
MNWLIGTKQKKTLNPMNQKKESASEQRYIFLEPFQIPEGVSFIWVDGIKKCILN